MTASVFVLVSATHAMMNRLRSHPEIRIVDVVVTQSSDSEFHCLTITVFFSDAPMR